MGRGGRSSGGTQRILANISLPLPIMRITRSSVVIRARLINLHAGGGRRSSSSAPRAKAPAPRAAAAPSKAAAGAPAPAPAAGSSVVGSALGHVASAITDGWLWGAGSAMAHRAMDAVLSALASSNDGGSPPGSCGGGAGRTVRHPCTGLPRCTYVRTFIYIRQYLYIYILLI